MARPPDPRLLDYLAPYDPRIASLALALREVVLEEAPEAIESLVNGYAVAIGFSFTGKPMKDGFCHVVTYKNCVNLGFNRGALLADPAASGASDLTEARRFLRAAIQQVDQVDGPSQRVSTKSTESASKRISHPK